ncbi:MAG: diacylglycerol kinase family protein [Dehalococcoidia bacterium]
MTAADQRPRLFLLINPMSGGGRTKQRAGALEAAVRRAGFEPEVALTGHPWHGYALTKGAIDAGHDTIVACGGDGTLYEAANAILDLGAAERVRLGTIPMGTGKDVAKCLGIGAPSAALSALKEGLERRIDAGRIELVDEHGHPRVRHFLLEASAGWVPEISRSVPRWLKRAGDTAPYLIMTGVKMLGPMTRHFDLAIDGEDLSDDYNSVSVHNMELWGGDLTVAPGALPDDALLDVIRWGNLGRRAVLAAVDGQRKGGTHLEMKGIDHHRAATVTMSASRKSTVDLDGEFGGYLPATVSVVPGALRFIAPPPAG